VSGAQSIPELLALIAGAGGDGWVRASGYDDFLLGRHPRPAELLRASGGRPVRLVHRTGHEKVATHAGGPPRPTAETMLAEATHFLAAARAAGISGVVDASGHEDPASVELVQEAARRAGVRAAVLVGPVLAASARTGVKIRRPPADWRALLPVARQCADGGLLLALHAVEASEMEGVIELALASGARVRAEHAGLLLDGQAERLAAAGVAVVVQPDLVRLRGDAYLARHPPALHGHLHPLRSLLAAGVRVGFSSDAPVTPADPAGWIRSAVARRSAGGRQVASQEAISAAQAEALARDEMGVSGLQP
jgi:predicted amidohydrolase YtcJ